jgi:inner membrane protein
MDTLTHTVLGACLGEAIAGKKLGKKAMLIGALANNLPDIDVMSALWTGPADELLVHRGITHSILFALVLSPLLALAFQRRVKNNSISFKRWLFLIGSGLFLHIFMDACTAYGTGWFEPFSHQRVSFNTLFILDPFFMLPLLLSALALLILKRDALKKRKWINTIGLSLGLLYLVTTIFIKLYVNRVISKDLSSRQITYQDYMATPTALNNILWYSVVKSNDNFYVGYYSIFDKTKNITWEFFQKHDSLLGPLKNTQEVQQLIHFSKNYYCIRKEDSLVTFSDIRFGQIGGWYIKQAPFVFNFNLERKHNKLNLQQGRFKSFSSKDFNLLVSRVKGIDHE